MISSDVPIASVIGFRNMITKAGTTRNPPPTPRKPVRKPTAAPPRATLAAVATRDPAWVPRLRTATLTLAPPAPASDVRACAASRYSSATASARSWSGLAS